MTDIAPDLLSLTTTYCPALTELHPEDNDRYPWSDLGNGNLYADFFGRIARYTSDRHIWCIFDGRVWRPDPSGLLAMELCKQLAANLKEYALTIKHTKMHTNYNNYVEKWQKRSYREIILRDAASVHPLKSSDFDCKPNIYNCLNGTLDLVAREFHKHSPEDMLTKLSGVEYDPEARCDRWEQFIDEVMEGDEERAVYFQKALGYALQGNPTQECFFILYGPTTRNGKGTAMETYLALMGDYGRAVSPHTIAQKKYVDGSGPTEDIARLAGARFINVSEPDREITLSSSLIKSWTGNDTISARFLHEGSFEFRPQFTIFVNTNHLPNVTDDTIFASERAKIIPFERHFSEEEQDKGLKAELAQPRNLSGILNWCLQGLDLFRSTGLEAPVSVREATDMYREQSDVIGGFLRQRLEKDAQAEERTKDVYDAYMVWCALEGTPPEARRTLNNRLRALGTVKSKRPRAGGENTTMLIGYKLI